KRKWRRAHLRELPRKPIASFSSLPKQLSCPDSIIRQQVECQADEMATPKKYARTADARKESVLKSCNAPAQAAVCDASPLRDDDVAAEGANRERRAAVAEHRVYRAPHPAPVVTAAERDGEIGSDRSAERVGVQLEARRIRQRQPNRSRVRRQAVAPGLVDA